MNQLLRDTEATKTGSSDAVRDANDVKVIDLGDAITETKQAYPFAVFVDNAMQLGWL